MAADPIAQEACGQVDRHLVAIDAGEGHLAQPGAVLDLADVSLEAVAHMRPLGPSRLQQSVGSGYAIRMCEPVASRRSRLAG